MPTAPAKACPCGGSVRSGVCDRCGPSNRDERKSSSERGYDVRWDAAKEAYLRTHPMCVCCLAMGKVNGTRGRRGLRVDHIVPVSMALELFWDRSNWQTLCLSCDMTYKQPIEKRCRTAEQVREQWDALLNRLINDTKQRSESCAGRA